MPVKGMKKYFRYRLFNRHFMPTPFTFSLKTRPLRQAIAATLICALPLSSWSQTEAAASAASSAATPQASTAATQAPLELHTENPEHIKGLKSVALAGFQVYYLTEFADGSTSQGGNTHGSIVSTHSNMKVMGLSPDKLQALTDELYQATLGLLKSKGIVVMDATALQALPAFAPYKAASDKSPLDFDAAGGKGTIFAATGLPLMHVYENGWLHRSNLPFQTKVDDHYASLGDKMGVGFRMTTLQPLLANLATEAKMPLLHVRLVLAPGGVQASKGGFFASSSETKTSSTLTLPVFANRFLVTTADGKAGRVSLNKGLASDQPVGELADVTSTAETAGNIALAAFSILASASGHGRAVLNNSKKQELRTSHEVFDPVARSQAQLLLGNLTAAVAP